MKEIQRDDITLARIIANVTGDGHLQNKGWRHIISYNSKHMEEIENFKARFCSLFRIQSHLYKDFRRKDPKYKIVFISRDIANFLQRKGTPAGNKTNTVFEIPNWIFNGSSEIKSSYLRGLYDNEGCIYWTKNGKKDRWRIGFYMFKNEALIDSALAYFEQIREILRKFEIKSSPPRPRLMNVRKDGSTSVQLQFDIEATSFQNFYKHIGFEHPIKRVKLLKALAAMRGYENPRAKRQTQPPAVGFS